MVIKFDERGGGNRKNIKADVIILGCSLPGIVTAHKLKKKFGNTMDIVVLDLPRSTKIGESKNNVAFLVDEEDSDEECYVKDVKRHAVIDNVARNFISKYARDFNITLPDAIIAPERCRDYALNKLFQYRNGSTVHCTKDYYDFDYLNFLEKFELSQFLAQLNQKMRDFFQSQSAANYNTDVDRKKMLYYDQTTMEKHICDALLFSTTREIMRTTVRLVCGAPPDSVSVFFYLHQCYRTNSIRNHVDGDNTRFREKLLGYCRKRLTNRLQQSIADITVPTKQITEIRTYSDEQVILETLRGETNYVCNLLAMALRPDELHKIRVEDQLLSEKEVAMTCTMTPGLAKKFIVQYEQYFWREDGFSGDILSIRGPIIWAMERPRMSTTGSQEKYAALIGYLKVWDDEEVSRDAVLEQLVKLFGEKARTPVTYKESTIADIFVPRCGDYVALRRLTAEVNPRHLEWGALDIFAEGDVAAALEAGHNAYIHLLTTLRPQAQTFEDARAAEWPTILNDTSPLSRWLVHMNITKSIRMVIYTTVLYVGVRLLHSYIRK